MSIMQESCCRSVPWRWRSPLRRPKPPLRRRRPRRRCRKADASAVTQVQGWGYRRYHRGHRRGWGAAPWIGLGAGVVVGSIIANEAYRPRRGYYYDDYAYDGPYYYPSAYSGDPRTVCAQNFRSFEWSTGLYTTYEGEKRLCPYLR